MADQTPQEAPPETPASPSLTTEAIGQRHPTWAAWNQLWRYYRDMYQGGVGWASKLNPMAGQGVSQPSIAGEMGGGGDFLPTTSGTGIGTGGTMVRYLWQYPLEKQVKFTHRLSRAFYVNILQPVVDFYSAIISKTDNIAYNGDSTFENLFNDVDLQGQSFLQFMTTARTNAAVIGHTFILVDSTKATGDVISERDVQDQGIRSYLIEVWPENMLNWRLDRHGKPLEILYQVEAEVPGNIADVQSQLPGKKYYYWNREIWQVYGEVRSATGSEVAVALEDSGKNTLGKIPLTVLYHKRVRPFFGEPLIKDSAKIGHIISNWASALDESFEAQMFAMPVLTSKNSPTDVGVGISVLMHLNPEANEKFEYVAPPVEPFTVAWDAFYRLVELANKHMGIAPAAVGSGKVDAKSGVSKAWDFFESEKILSRMAGNEQDVADELLDLVKAWGDAGMKAEISYKTKFDLSTAEDDINDLISLQSAGVPLTARKEMMRQVCFKKLPNMSDAIRKKINIEVDAIIADPVEIPTPGGNTAPGGLTPALPKPIGRSVDRSGRALIAPPPAGAPPPAEVAA